MVDRAEGQSLEDYLNERVFSQAGGVTMTPLAEDVEGFRRVMDAAFGEGRCMVLRIRPVGATKI